MTSLKPADGASSSTVNIPKIATNSNTNVANTNTNVATNAAYPVASSPQLNHLSALKTAMVMGPTPRSSQSELQLTQLQQESKNVQPSVPTNNNEATPETKTIEVTTTTCPGTGTRTTLITTITTTKKSISPVPPPASTVAQTAGLQSSTTTGATTSISTNITPKDGARIAPTSPKLNQNTNRNSNSNLMDSSKGMRSVTRPTAKQMSVPGGPEVGIDNLLAGMDSIRQDTIDSDEIGFATTMDALGKDVTTLIGRIEKRGLAASASLSAATATISSSDGGGSGSDGVVAGRPATSEGVRTQTPTPKANHGPDRGKSGSSSAAHDFGASRVTPKTQKSSRLVFNSSRAASASHAHKVNATASAKSFVETRSDGRKSAGGKNSSKGEVPLRPSTSLYRPASSIAFKGGLVSTQPLKLKSTKSFTALKPNYKMGDAAAGDGATTTTTTVSSEAKPTLKELFAAFSRFGDTSSDGKQISLTNSDKWMKQAHVIDGKKITTTDTSILFKKLFKTAKKVSFEDFKKYTEELATSKKIEPQELQDKLIGCGPPGLSSATRAAHAGVVERLTDTSKYTGSHKERFDSTGKGRGIEGRRDVKDGSGYTAAFKTKIAGDKNGGSASGSGSTSPVPPTK